MVLHMAEREVEIKRLGLKVNLLVTRTNHRAVQVAWNPSMPMKDQLGNDAKPGAVSEKEDLIVYFLNEAGFHVLYGAALLSQEEEFASVEHGLSVTVRLGARGAKVGDKRGDLTSRRRQELQRAKDRLCHQDRRTEIALMTTYTLAEKWATKDFHTIVLFEPFGGTFGVTRAGSSMFGWTNSQPLDVLDGHDLLTASGRHLLWRVLEEHEPYLVLIAFDCRLWTILRNLSPGKDWDCLRKTIGRKTLKLVAAICRYQHGRGRYYLLENPQTSMAWVFEGILDRLKQFGGKKVVGDQCAYGHRDRESGRPIKKPTGWMSNCEVRLNELGKRCQCQ